MCHDLKGNSVGLPERSFTGKIWLAVLIPLTYIYLCSTVHSAHAPTFRSLYPGPAPRKYRWNLKASFCDQPSDMFSMDRAKPSPTFDRVKHRVLLQKLVLDCGNLVKGWLARSSSCFAFEAVLRVKRDRAFCVDSWLHKLVRGCELNRTAAFYHHGRYIQILPTAAPARTT